MSSTRRVARTKWGASGGASKHVPPLGVAESYASRGHRLAKLEWIRHGSGLEDREKVGKAEPGPHSFLSVVVPAKDEAACLPQRVAEIAGALRPLCIDLGAIPRRLGGFEMILVDDGSTDETVAIMETMDAVRASCSSEGT